MSVILKNTYENKQQARHDYNHSLMNFNQLHS